jgi:hypothetical protein
LPGSAVSAQGVGDDGVLDALLSGGLVIVMRHASSPREAPDASRAAPGNVTLERQLDEAGRQAAIAMGDAIRRAGIPIAEVLSSPTFRALQTARLLNLGGVEPIPDLGDGGRGMQRDDEGLRSAWLAAKAAEPVPPRSNRLVITHTPNLIGAFGDAAAGMAQGESLILEARDGSLHVVGRVRIEQWPMLAATR